IVEVVEVEPERAVVFDIDQLAQDQVDVLRLAVGREAHQLVFAGVDREAEVIGEGGIEQAQGMRETNFFEKLYSVANSAAERGGAPLADAVDCENCGRLEGRGIERRGGVGEMMLREKNLATEVRAE